MIAGEKALLRKGCGYWRIDRYPKGGEFHRAQTDLVITIAETETRYSDGAPKEYIATIDDFGARISVKTDCLYHHVV